MISKPIEDITKACETAEESAASKQIDYAVVYVRNTESNPVDYRGNYSVVAVVDLEDQGEYRFWQIICIFKPFGMVYQWAKDPIPGFEYDTGDDR